MLTVYALAWRALRRGARPEPWFVLALLTFSMTTFWSLIYLYFDVFALASAALACHVLAGERRSLGPLRGVAGLFAAAAVIVATMAWVQPGPAYAIDIGTTASAGLTGGGFGNDVAVTEAGRTFVWVEGESARGRLPRASRSTTKLHVIARAQAIAGFRRQRVAAVLNGHTLGLSVLGSEWTDLTFVAPRKTWYYGFNLLELRFSYALPLGQDVASEGTGPGSRLQWTS